MTEPSDRSHTAHALGDFIRDQRRIARLSLRKLSGMAQISNPYLSQIERGLRKPSAEILQQLAKALRISAETLYVQAGILEERPDASDLSRSIWDDPTLTEAQKRALVQVYRSFQAENRPDDEVADVLAKDVLAKDVLAKDVLAKDVLAGAGRADGEQAPRAGR